MDSSCQNTDFQSPSEFREKSQLTRNITAVETCLQTYCIGIYCLSCEYAYQTTAKDILVQVFSPRSLCNVPVSQALNYIVYRVGEETYSVQDRFVYFSDYNGIR